MLTRRTFFSSWAPPPAWRSPARSCWPRRGQRLGPALCPHGSNGVEHVVVLMMENRSFDHFLGWLPGADGRHDLAFLSTDGNVYPNYPLAPDFQGCGYSDPDHSWEGFLVQHNFGKMDGFLQRPTAPADNPGRHAGRRQHLPGRLLHQPATTTPAQGRSRPAGHRRAGRALHGAGPLLLLVRGRDVPEPVLPARGPDRPGPQQRHDLHAARRSGTSCRRSRTPRASPPAATSSATCRSWPCGARSTSRSGTRSPPATPTPSASRSPPCRSSTPWPRAQLPNVSFVDPAFDTEGNGTSADDHPLADIRLGERFIADTYHALASAGYLDNTVLMVTFDEWGGFYDHVPPPRVIDDTNPANVDHTGDGTTPTDGQLIPDYRQLGFRVPAIVVSNLAPRRVVHHGPFEHASTLKLIESTFGLQPLTARDAHAENLGQVLRPPPAPPGPGRRHPDQQPGARAGQRRRPRSAAPTASSRSRRPRSAGASARRRPRRSPPPGSPRAPGWWSSVADTASKRAGRHRLGPQKPRLIPALTRNR